MITSIRISSVEAKRTRDTEITGLDINIGIDGVKVVGTKVIVDFNYIATYREEVGTLKMTGTLESEEDHRVSAEIDKLWAKEKRLPDGFSELVLNAVNFTCGTNGVLVVRPVNLAPPMVPPRIEIAKGGAAGGSAGPEEKVAPSGRMK